MGDYEKVTNHVTTYKISEKDFQKINMGELPKDWEYNQMQHPTGGTQHTFKRRWILNFKKDVLPSLQKDEPKLFDLAKSSWVIDEQARQKIALANVLGIVGTSAEQKYMNKTAERLVARGKAKTLKEALEMIS